MRAEQVGTAGTGKYEGFVWDGRRWVNPVTMEVGRFDPWQRTSLPWRIVLVAAVSVAIVYLVLTYA